MLKQFLSTITKLLNRCSLLTKAVKKQNFFLFKFLLWNNFKLRNLENTYWVFPHIFFSSLTTFVSRRRVWRAFLQKGGPQGWKEESQGLPVARKFINNKERKNKSQSWTVLGKWEHIKKEHREHPEREVDHAKGGKWPWRAGVQNF